MDILKNGGRLEKSLPIPKLHGGHGLSYGDGGLGRGLAYYCGLACLPLQVSLLEEAEGGEAKKWVPALSGGRKLGGFSRSVPGLEAAYRCLLGSAHADPLTIAGPVVVHVLAG